MGDNEVWASLGTFTMDSGLGHGVEMVDPATAGLGGDRMSFALLGAAANSYAWTPTLPAAGRFLSFHFRQTA